MHFLTYTSCCDQSVLHKKFDHWLIFHRKCWVWLTPREHWTPGGTDFGPAHLSSIYSQDFSFWHWWGQNLIQQRLRELFKDLNILFCQKDLLSTVRTRLWVNCEDTQTCVWRILRVSVVNGCSLTRRPSHVYSAFETRLSQRDRLQLYLCRSMSHKPAAAAGKVPNNWISSNSPSVISPFPFFTGPVNISCHPDDPRTKYIFLYAENFCFFVFCYWHKDNVAELMFSFFECEKLL